MLRVVGPDGFYWGALPCPCGLDLLEVSLTGWSMHWIVSDLRFPLTLLHGESSSGSRLSTTAQMRR